MANYRTKQDVIQAGLRLRNLMAEHGFYERCSECGRKTWSQSDLGTTCGMPQPNGERCKGIFSTPGPSCGVRDQIVTLTTDNFSRPRPPKVGDIVTFHRPTSDEEWTITAVGERRDHGSME